ncbi:outer membrane beta-barrel protein [Allomuricauda sp. SCSIO 65647]|uniref:outer membrane beta-barrel protein n=1 Tax=Allomuricauda sp. SCSIO 65647 TaxID=2908843 RepID=UPI001F355B43|nr:outer membrane beta-barrel protein [Muricauda sp. SCSIO 65647]UJH68995.1 outer membrane beta-barrel protein [Muricauda sp. SCSIO 65647]
MEYEELEKLFKEKFKDFRPEPDERVWKSIEVSLDKKKSRRTVIPIWWRLGGIAALLAILFYIINPFDDASEQIPQTQQQVTGTEDVDKKGEDALVKEDSTAILKSNSEPTQLTETSEGSKIENPSNLAHDDETHELVSKGAEKNQSVDQVQIASNQQDNPSVTKEKQFIEETVGDTQKDAVAVQNQEVIENAVEKNGDKDQKQLFDKNVEEEENVVANVDEQQDQNKGKSIFEAIEEQNNDEQLVAENEQGKWSVGPSVAPVYFNALGEGSPIHSNFAPNNKSGNLNLSYGLAVTYQISDRLAVRSGVHRVDYGYDTNDISFSSSPTESTNGEIENIDYAQASRSIVVQSNAKETPNANETFDVLAPSAELDGRMVQQMGYVEVPVELSYSLIDRKFGVNFIGGFSSLFLVDNTVSLESQGLVTEMGEANNVNNVNFSANAGIGLDYKFSPKIRFSLEPVFKYQLNTFSDTSGNFRPYTIGVYSGVNFRF